MLIDIFANLLIDMIPQSFEFINGNNAENVRNMSRDSISYFLSRYLGNFAVVVVFFSLVFSLGILAMVTEDSTYEIIDIEVLLRNQTISHINGTSSDTTAPKKTYDEMSFAALIFFGMLTFWAIIQTAKIMRDRRQLQDSGYIGLLRRNGNSNSVADMLRLRMALARRDFTAEDYEVLRMLDEGNVDNTRQQQIRQRAIGLLPTHVFHADSIPHTEGRTSIEEEFRNCTICLDNFQENETIRTLPCAHQFHKDCVDRWLENNPLCPICKRSIIPLSEQQ